MAVGGDACGQWGKIHMGQIAHLFLGELVSLLQHVRLCAAATRKISTAHVDVFVSPDSCVDLVSVRWLSLQGSVLMSQPGRCCVKGIAFLFVLSLACLPAYVIAGPLTPPSLNPGDPYRLVFATSTIHDATSGDIADYNSIVQLAADSSLLSPLGQTWTAIASTDAIDARDNTVTNPSVHGAGVPIFLFHSLIAADYNDLWSGQGLSHVIDRTEHGDLLPSFARTVWTGTAADGTAAELSPTISPLGGLNPQSVVGDSFASGSLWVADASQVHSNFNRLYGLSGVIIAVPEPLPLMQLWWLPVAFSFSVSRSFRVSRNVVRSS